MRDPVTGNIAHLFATPILQRVWPNTGPLNEGLKRIVLARRQQSPGTKRSNVGGWQSTHDLLQWAHPEIATLHQYIQQVFGEMMEAELGTAAFQCKLSFAAWANVNTDGDYNRIHSHGDCHYSGVYYVTLGEPDPARKPNGAIEFLDPRGAAAVGRAPGLPSVSAGIIEPLPGTMILFPSWLNHGVLPYFGKGERISIAFNIRVRDLSLDKK